MSKKQIQLNWLLLISVGFIISMYNLRSPLKGRHAWANADHYAISLGFLNNSFDFFHPETYCLNPQFSPNQKSKTDFWQYPPNHATGITTVDFPIHQYTVAILMKIFHTKSPAVFKWYTLLISLLGIYFLGKTIFLHTKSYPWSIFLQLFVLLSPTYSFYASSFLPSSPALAFLFISSYFISKYFLQSDHKSFLIGIVFLTFAALMRFPFINYLIAFVCYYTLQLIIYKKRFVKNTLLCLVAISFVMLYFFYNKYYLFKNFGSNFLSYPLPPNSFKNAILTIFYTLYHESWRYFTIIHYGLLMYFGIIVFKHRKQLNLKKPILIYLSIVTLGILTYMFLMLQQFVAHDYYALDTFFPILIFWMIGVYTYIPKHFLHSKLRYGLLFSTIILNLLVFYFGYKARDWSPLEKTRKNFANANTVLDSLQIPTSAKVLLIDSYSPNLAFIQLNRKGYCVMDTTKDNIQKAMQWNYDYIITQNFSYQESVLTPYPKFKEETRVFFSNNRFTIHLKK